MSDAPAGNAKTLRVAAIGDYHCRLGSGRAFRPVFEQIAAEADVLLVCGDITHMGLPEEGRIFLEQAAPALGKIPVLGVLGNHDFESGKQDDLRRQLSEAGVIMLDGDSLEIRGVGFTGVKGFGGGFGRMAVEPLGEAVMKDFVREAEVEAQKLENGLSGLNGGPIIVVLHYAPICGTVAGEPPELHCFLGSSRLEAPLNRREVSAVFHGHAHYGCFEGKTGANAPVYNVSAAVLKRRFPDRLPFFISEVQVKKS